MTLKRVMVWMMCLFCSLGVSQASASRPWAQYIQGVRIDAVDEGVRPEVFDRAFSKIHEPKKKVKRLAKRQPETRLTFKQYRKSRIDSYRILLGKRAYKKHKKLLEKIGREYQVDPCVITALWGIETSYGRYMGKFPVIASLATLAYSGNRKAFFRRELIYALKILNEGHVPAHKFVGEWAGGSGHPQFLPSSWFHYAQDYDGDGRRDIWQNKADVFASIANYIHKNGWQYSQPWGTEVTAPKSLSTKSKGLKEWHSVGWWLKQGVKRRKGERPFPSKSTQAALVVMDGGSHFLAYRNFKVIMTYNRSTYYAASVGYLADRICQR